MMTSQPMPRPVATATPTGYVRINRRYRRLPTTTLRKIKYKEDEYRREVILIADWKAWNKQAPTIDWDNFPVTSRANFESSRKVVRIEVGDDHLFVGIGGDRSNRSRSHSRTKSKYRSWQRVKNY